MSKRRGHFCWSCERLRPNEKFSGAGHARQLCRECVRLGPEELKFRQARRNIERLFDWQGRIRRKGKATLARLLADPDERLRRYAQDCVSAVRDDENRPVEDDPFEDASVSAVEDEPTPGHDPFEDAPELPEDIPF
jgi:hypothetical protein